VIQKRRTEKKGSKAEKSENRAKKVSSRVIFPKKGEKSPKRKAVRKKEGP
jgi:hypothetical protein